MNTSNDYSRQLSPAPSNGIANVDAQLREQRDRLEKVVCRLIDISNRLVDEPRDKNGSMSEVSEKRMVGLMSNLYDNLEAYKSVIHRLEMVTEKLDSCI